MNRQEQNSESKNIAGTPEPNQHSEIEPLSERQDTQKFWRKLIFDVFGIINQDEYIEFEKRVLVGRTKFIDAYIPSTGIVIEQKSQGVDLTLPERRDCTMNCVKVKSTGGLHHERGKTGKTQDK